MILRRFAIAPSLCVVVLACSSGTPTPSTGKVPATHRATPAACPAARGSSPIASPGANDPCKSDQDCTAGTNGRCQRSGNSAAYGCSYDQCANDDACGAKGVCNCRASAEAGAANVCTTGTCAIDSDCGSGRYCVPSVAACSGTPTYYCTTEADECVNDADCPTLGNAPAQQAQGCRYSAEVGHFKCTTRVACAG